MATAKAKKSAAPKQAAAASKKRAPRGEGPEAPFRRRPVQMIVRLSLEEKETLDEVVARWEANARAQGFVGEGVAQWFRSILWREKQAMSTK